MQKKHRSGLHNKHLIQYLFRIITIQSSPDEEQKDRAATLTPETILGMDSGVNLYILAGHEAMQL